MEKKTIFINKFAFDSKGRVRFSTFIDFVKKADHKLLNSLTIVCLALLFGLIFLLFSFIAIKTITLTLFFKVAYLMLSFSLSLAGFGFFLYSLNNLYKAIKMKLALKKELAIESELFQRLLKEEKERHNALLMQKKRELQKLQNNLEDLHKLSLTKEEGQDIQKIVNLT